MSIINTSSVSLRLPPSPTGEGWQNAEFFRVKMFTMYMSWFSSNDIMQRKSNIYDKRFDKPSPVGEGGAVYRDG